MARILKDAKQTVPEFLGSGGGGGGGGSGAFGGTDFRSNKSAPPPAHGKLNFELFKQLFLIVILPTKSCHFTLISGGGGDDEEW